MYNCISNLEGKCKLTGARKNYSPRITLEQMKVPTELVNPVMPFRLPSDELIFSPFQCRRSHNEVCDFASQSVEVPTFTFTLYLFIVQFECSELREHETACLLHKNYSPICISRKSRLILVCIFILYINLYLLNKA